MEGSVEGIQIKALDIAQSILMRGYDPNEVTSITGLSQELMRQLSQQG